MTFLQPIVLWGLPLILVPVLIHLINRMRHRPQPWAAMRFLLFATRRSMSHAKLRQWLVLLFRVLAVLMLVLFLGRPLAGGWLGWALSPAPDAILILLDRSASMETQSAGTGLTRREQALQQIAQSVRPFQGTSHLILIDSALRAPQEIANASSLEEPSLTGPTDTAADLPALVQAAANWLLDNHAGTAELWIASDLQRSNWHPDDTRWKSAIARLEALLPRIRVRLLALNQDAPPNLSISVEDVVRRQRGAKGELQFTFDLRLNRGKADPFPLTITLDGARSQVQLAMDSPALRWRHTVPLGDRQAGGWGSVALPPDANPRDNMAYFVYGPETPLRAGIVSADPISRRYFQLAAAAESANGARRPAESFTPAEAAGASWAEKTLLIWQDALPVGPLAERVRSFAEEGGVVIFFPTGQGDARRFNGTGWREAQSAETGGSFRIRRWDDSQGPLAKTDEGLSLPLAQATFSHRQLIVGPKNVLAAFADGAPFLARQSLGRGEIFFCASLPDPSWSSLGDGPVLVPLLQRLLQAGSRRLQQATAVACGELSAVDAARHWEPVGAKGPRDVRIQAGVYRSGNRLLAVNRPAAEDEPEVLEPAAARRLFGNLPFQALQEQRRDATRLQGEIWRLLLLMMLGALVVEGLLIRPPSTAADRSPAPTARPRVGTSQPEVP